MNEILFFKLRCLFSSAIVTFLMVLYLFSWTDSKELWRSMVEKDLIYRRNSGYMANHPDLQSRMRSILLDWLMEVWLSFVMSRVVSCARGILFA